MADVTRLLTSAAEWTVVATKNDNTNAVATQAAPGANKRLYVSHIMISASAAPSAVVSATLEDGASGTVKERVEIPAAAFAPISINFVRPIALTANTAAVATLPAIGGTTRGTITMKGFTLSD